MPVWNTLCQQDGLSRPMPGHVLGAAATAYEPRTRAASAPGRQPPVRRRGRGASPGAGRGHRPPNPAAQGPSWTPRTTSSPAQLLTGPRGRTAANIAASGPSDRAAGRPPPPAFAALIILLLAACCSSSCLLVVNLPALARWRSC